MGVCHNNINLSNVHYDGTQVFMTGFGLIKPFENNCDPRMANHDIHFMSPEEILRKPLDSKSDLYSAGVLLHLLLTGKYPFSAGSLGERVNLKRTMSRSRTR